MSIQNRLLFLNTVVFSAAFILIAMIVYVLPRNRILAEVDNDLYTLASEIVRPGNAMLDTGGVLRIPIPQDLDNFTTASTFITIIDLKGEVIARSSNLANFDSLLDNNYLNQESHFSWVHHEDALLRVFTQPVIVDYDTTPRVVGYLEVARLLDTYETFNRLLSIALLVALAAATASLFLTIWLTPSIFQPLEEIAAIARQISRADDLSRRVPDTNRTDEIGDLARALNQTLERLERLFHAQQRLMADVSHELRTPLTAIRGNVDLIRRMGEADPESLAAIQAEIERMTRLVSDLLLLARADTGALPMQKKVVELDNLLFDVYRQARILQGKVEVSISGVDQVSVWGDTDRLKQLFLNLVDNAIKYTLPGGKVALCLSKENGWAKLEISDTGIGIAAKDLPYIFDRFYRVDKARTRTQGGSGLGLSIAKWIVQAHDGEIQIRSEVGVGTTFTVLLPVWVENSTQNSLAVKNHHWLTAVPEEK